MSCLEKNVNEDYFSTKYDLMMLLCHVDGKGGLTLVIDTIFDWGENSVYH